MTDSSYDWSRFDVHIDTAEPIAAAYDRWATSDGMASFFTRTFAYASSGLRRAGNERAQTGDAYTLTFHHPFELSGTVLAATPDEHFAITYGAAMRVDVTLASVAGGTRVKLVQSQIPTDPRGQVESHLNCRSCWCYYLLNLKSVVAHGIDLRDDGLADNPVSVFFGATAG